MKNRVISFGIMLVTILLFNMCDKSEDINNDNIEEPDVHEEEQYIWMGVKGNIQKGPFISGSSIIVQELDSSFLSTGISFNTVTNNDFGGFGISNKIVSPYVEIITSGFYYDEVKGSISDANLSLRTLVEISDSILTNVNLLTTLSKERIIFLVENQGLDFKKAKIKAQNEVLEIFDIPKNDSINFNGLDISQDGDENAILLAASIVLQGNLSVGELSEMISKIIQDIKEDGQISNQNISNTLEGNAESLNLEDVRENLINRYNSLNCDVSISFFEKYAKRLVPLEIVSTSPTINEKEVPYNLDTITIAFNKALDVESINLDNIIIKSSSDEILKGEFEYIEDEFKIIYHIQEELEPEMRYSLVVKSDLSTLDNEFLDSDFEISFTSTSVDIQDGLKALYTFEGNCDDITGNNNDANPINIEFIPSDIGGNSNLVAKFSGEGSYMTFPSVINPTQLNWSYSIWFRFDERIETNGPILLGTHFSSEAFDDIPLYFRTSSKCLCSYNGRVLETGFDINNETWYHVVVTVENAYERIYINGELLGDGVNFPPSSEDGDVCYRGFNLDGHQFI